MVPVAMAVDHPSLVAFRQAFQRGQLSRAEEFLAQLPSESSIDLLWGLLECELLLRRERGETPAIEEYTARFPSQHVLFERLFSNLQRPSSAIEVSQSAPSRKDEFATETWNESRAAVGAATERMPSIPGYEIIQFLGQGGMGYVVQARDVKLNRMVALKLPLPEKLRNAGDRERFLREARSAARLRHHGICAIYEIGEAAGQPYLALAYIAGQPLSAWAKGNKPSARQSAEIVAAVAEAVQVAHEHGVIHRDLKPGNVMIEQSTGAPILMDFGLAKDQSSDDVNLTFDGAILGTPAYMSPEQASGAVERVGPRSDVYGLGAILYSLLSGQPPFSGTFGEVMRLVQMAEPVPPRKLHLGLHRDLETICLKAMAKDPQDRYDSARALGADLRRFTNGEAILARPEGILRGFWRTVRRRPGFALTAAAVLAVLIVAAGVARQTTHDRQVAQATEQFDAQLQDDNWSQARFQQLQTQIQKLERLDPTTARKAQGRLVRRFYEHLERAIDRPAHSPDDLDLIRQELSFLAGHEPAAAKQLESELDGRLRAWKAIFALSAPFANMGDVFNQGLVQVANSRLVTHPAKASTETITKPPARIPDPDIITSHVPCGGNVEWRATFSETSLYKVSRLGLTLNADGNQGYEFVLTAVPRLKASIGESTKIEPPGDEASQLATISQGWHTDAQVELRIVRNGLIVRRQPVLIGGSTFELAAKREAGRLSCQVNSQPPLVFEDIFPLGTDKPGMFGLILPPGAEVIACQASRQALPVDPSPLEQGDYLLSNQQFQEAFDNYREQEAGAQFDVRQESRMKQALCLVQLNRDDEAAQLLEQVAGEDGPRWPIIAACHLWLIRLRQARFEDAELIREVLASRYQFEELASLLPENLRYSVIKEYLAAAQGSNLATFNQERLSRMERVVETERLVGGQRGITSQLLLLRGYRAVDDNQKALSVAKQLLDTPQENGLSQFDRVWLVEEYCWLLRLEDRTSEALEYINRRLESKPGDFRVQWLPLLVERARLHAVRGDLVAAEADLNTLLTRLSTGQLSYRHYSAAKLLLGFIREDRGDLTGAQDAWAEGIYSVWYPEYERQWESVLAPAGEPAHHKLPPLPAEHPHHFSGVEFVQFAMLSSLSDRLTEEEAQRMFRWLSFRSGNAPDGTVLSVVSLLQSDLAFRTFRQLCHTTRGKSVARRVAFQSMSLREFVDQPLYLIVYEIAHQGAFPTGLTEAQDEVVWRAAQESHSSYLSGKITKSQLLNLAFTWKGQTGVFGWDGIAAALDPKVRGYMAFIFGHRMLQRKQLMDAARMFRTAVTDGGFDETLRKEAEEELHRLITP